MLAKRSEGHAGALLRVVFLALREQRQAATVAFQQVDPMRAADVAEGVPEEVSLRGGRETVRVIVRRTSLDVCVGMEAQNGQAARAASASRRWWGPPGPAPPRRGLRARRAH